MFLESVFFITLKESAQSTDEQTQLDDILPNKTIFTLTY